MAVVPTPCMTVELLWKLYILKHGVASTGLTSPHMTVQVISLSKKMNKSSASSQHLGRTFSHALERHRARIDPQRPRSILH